MGVFTLEIEGETRTLSLPEGAGELHRSPFGEGWETFHLSENRREGICLSFYATGAQAGSSYYKAGQLHGPVVHRSKEGAQLAESTYFEGKKWGVAQLWHPNGALYSRQHFVRGIFEGAQLYYFPSGQLRSQLHFLLGKPEGRAQQFYESGQLRRQVDYRGGQRHGLDQMLFPNGSMQMEATYEEGVITGQMRLYHDNGQVAEAVRYQGPSWQFDRDRFDREGALVSEGKSLDGGLYEEREYDASGRLISHTKRWRSSEGKVRRSERLTCTPK